jgi:ABC-type bacteriocin/lantibiotic exporter with double-glycine peptidase domain
MLFRLSALRAINLKYTDSRVKLTNEILQGVRAIKSYNWEKPFLDKLTTIRDLELKALEASANTRAILTSVLTAAPSMVAVVTLGTYGLLGNVLTPTKVFTALALFNQLRFPLVFLPLLLNNLAEGKVSLVRLTKFLLTDEVQDPKTLLRLKMALSRGALILPSTQTW